MTGFFRPQERVVHLDDENRITIRRLTWGQVQGIRSRTIRMRVQVPTSPTRGLAANGNPPDNDPGEIDLDPYRFQEELVVESVVSWEGPGFEGRPVTRENVLALPEWIVEKLLAEIDKLNQGITESEKKS